MVATNKISVPAIPALPDGKPVMGLRRYLEELTAFIQRELRRRPESTTALNEVLLLTPNGSVYSVTAANDGTLTSTLVSS